MARRVITDAGLVAFFRKHASKSARQHLGLSFPRLGKNRGKMLINPERYTEAVQLYSWFRNRNDLLKIGFDKAA